MQLALATVDILWAMMIVAHPFMSRAMASSNEASVDASTALVGSSRIKIGAALSIARAMESL